MNKAIDRVKLAALIDWYRLAGVDVLISETPLDRFALAERPRPPAAVRETVAPATFSPAPREATSTSTAPAPAVHRPAPLHSPAAALAEARELAARARSLDELKSALAGFDGCGLKRLAKNLCFADGSDQARLMLIGEAPGRDEDLAGVPFVGRAGQLLDKMLAAAGLHRQEDVWITNTVFWRPPGNRVPSPEETEICRPFLERQIELIAPSVILALGGAAAKQLLGTTSGIMRLRGKWQRLDIGGRAIDVLPSLHPAFLLRNPDAKRLAWHDLLLMREKLDELAPPRP